MLCKAGELGLVKTVPDTLKPGSDVANLAVMGYEHLVAVQTCRQMSLNRLIGDVVRRGILSAYRSAVGRGAGMRVIEVEGATGTYETNFAGKAKAAIDALPLPRPKPRDCYLFHHSNYP